jgi:RNA polymerase sigma factor (sigma-70 family)
VDLGGLEETLEKLAELHPRQHEVVTLRFYGGWRMREIADMLEVSLWTVEGDFRAARAFLRGQLGEGQTP